MVGAGMEEAELSRVQPRMNSSLNIMKVRCCCSDGFSTVFCKIQCDGACRAPPWGYLGMAPPQHGRALSSGRQSCGTS